MGVARGGPWGWCPERPRGAQRGARWGGRGETLGGGAQKGSMGGSIGEDFWFKALLLSKNKMTCTIERVVQGRSTWRFFCFRRKITKMIVALGPMWLRKTKRVTSLMAGVQGRSPWRFFCFRHRTTTRILGLRHCVLAKENEVHHCEGAWGRSPCRFLLNKCNSMSVGATFKHMRAQCCTGRH